jgi:hypothetical protein
MIGHQWWYGGTQSVTILQRSKIMSWGYASTKRLIAPPAFIHFSFLTSIKHQSWIYHY